MRKLAWLLVVAAAAGCAGDDAASDPHVAGVCEAGWTDANQQPIATCETACESPPTNETGSVPTCVVTHPPNSPSPEVCAKANYRVADGVEGCCRVTTMGVKFIECMSP